MIQKFVDKVYAMVMADEQAAGRPAWRKWLIVGILLAFSIAFIIMTLGFMQKNITL